MGLSMEMFVFEKSTAVPWGLMVYFDGTQSTNIRDRANYSNFAAAACWISDDSVNDDKGTQRPTATAGYPPMEVSCYWERIVGGMLLRTTS